MIDLLEAQKRITEAVAGREDYVYPRVADGAGSCVYFQDGQPSCLVGHALAAELRELGVPSKYLNDLGIEADEFVGSVITRDAATYLGSVQEAQDSGKTWGEALRRGNDTYRTLVADW